MRRRSLPHGREHCGIGNGARIIVTCAGLFLIFAVGVFAVGDAAAPLRIWEDRSSEYNFATIKLGREGDFCRRAIFDNKTGALTDNGRAACVPAKY